MSLIFGGFENKEQAIAFISAVKERFGLDGQIFDTEVDAQLHDPFPFSSIRRLSTLNERMTMAPL
jgi:hypothetical protein